ncbi:MAG: hypothetical protein H7268_15560 [Sandarakinorhabdus sp.]|nr:hypothetical protein [Sandarakinorhabdus sp.]
MVLAYPDDAAIAAVAAGVLDRSLPSVAWTHAAHFAAALWLTRHHPSFNGPREMPAIIRAYNEAVGTLNTDSGGYHHTITLASLRVVDAALTAGGDAPLHITLDSILAGPCGRSDWLLAHWSSDRLFDAAARRAWCDPDLAPLPV